MLVPMTDPKPAPLHEEGEEGLDPDTDLTGKYLDDDLDLG